MIEASNGGPVLARAVNAWRRYEAGEREVVAVADASCEVEPGDRIALVGPSGSGKTTLLHMLAGLETPSEGLVEWPGIGPRDSLRPGPVAVAFQGESLLPPLTSEENVALPLLLSGERDEDAARAALIALARFDVDEVSARLPEDISGGQAQRVALARSTVGPALLVLADEPTGQQDRVTAGRVVDALLAWADETGAALVIATHDPDIAERFPRKWEMQSGRLHVEVTSRSR
jgi:ABC-type lipoprotein export system ATPase subunit